MSGDRLPLLCRLLGHGWRQGRLWAPNQTEAWSRSTCWRCVGREIETPVWRDGKVRR